MPIKLRNDTVLVFIFLFSFIRLSNIWYNNYLTNKENLNTASIIADIPRLYKHFIKDGNKKVQTQSQERAKHVYF